MNIEELRILLKQGSEEWVTQSCRDALSDPSLGSVATTGPLPIEHVRRIYRVRVDTSEPGAVEGFEALLNSLDAENYELVNIHSFEANKKVFSVFTDDSATKLIGILISKQH